MDEELEKDTDLSESLIFALLLALTGGFLDAYTYVLRGGVFATMQTGNMILLVIKGIEFDWIYTLNYVFPIIAFALGVVLSEFLKDIFIKTKVKWQQVILLIEASILTIVVFIPFGDFNIYATCLISIVAALQMNGFHKMRGHPFFSTMCTGNLNSCFIFLYKGIKTRDSTYIIKAVRYISIITFFMLGALVGCLLFEFTNEYSLFFPCGILLICFLILFFRRNQAEVLPDKSTSL